MSRAGAEATAPARVDLSGWPLDRWPVPGPVPDALWLSVAIDRRAWCRAEALPGGGIRIESKDDRLTVEGPSAARVADEGTGGMAARVLEAMGIESGLSLATQMRVPADSGLGGSSALATAVAAAAARVAGRDLEGGATWDAIGRAESRHWGRPIGPDAAVAAFHGGVVATRRDGETLHVERLAADPACVEECLLIFDSGLAPRQGLGALAAIAPGAVLDPAVRDGLARLGAAATRAREALVSHRYREMVDVVAEQWEARRLVAPGGLAPELERLALSARSAGAAACPCGEGRMVAVWAPPGQAEEVATAVRGAGFRPVSFRVDLRGLEVEPCRGL